MGDGRSLNRLIAWHIRLLDPLPLEHGGEHVVDLAGGIMSTEKFVRWYVVVIVAHDACEDDGGMGMKGGFDDLRGKAAAVILTQREAFVLCKETVDLGFVFH